MYVYMNVCICMCMYIFTYVCMYVFMYERNNKFNESQKEIETKNNTNKKNS